MQKCLLEATEPAAVEAVELQIMPATFTAEAARDAEFALVESYGHERYADAELLRKHVNDTLIRFRISLMMDTIYRGCGYDSPNKPSDLLESAAWHAGKDPA